MPHSLDEILARADELADEFERYEPSESDRGDEPPLMALRRAVYRRYLAEQALLDAVRQARQKGATWATIGDELGTSGEAARQRYGSKVA